VKPLSIGLIAMLLAASMAPPCRAASWSPTAARSVVLRSVEDGSRSAPARAASARSVFPVADVASPQDKPASDAPLGVVDGGAPGGSEDSPGAPVPEPGTLFLVGSGLVGLAVSSRRWRRALGRDGV
jgi:hypothetical protein